MVTEIAYLEPKPDEWDDDRMLRFFAKRLEHYVTFHTAGIPIPRSPEVERVLAMMAARMRKGGQA